MVVRTTSQATRFGASGIGSAKVVRVLDFPAWFLGVNGVMRFFGT